MGGAHRCDFTMYHLRMTRRLAVRAPEPPPCSQCVAVEPSLRRSGLAQELCTRLDALAVEWALGGTLLMQVPQANAAARWLGAKMGFREGFRGSTSSYCGPQAESEEREEREGEDPDEEGGGMRSPPIVVTLGKKLGPVSWRLMAPIPPFD